MGKHNIWARNSLLNSYYRRSSSYFISKKTIHHKALNDQLYHAFFPGNDHYIDKNTTNALFILACDS